MVSFAEQRSLGGTRTRAASSLLRRLIDADGTTGRFAQHQAARAERLLASDVYVRLAR